MSEFHDYVIQDVLGHLDGITSKNMFGGHAIYRDGVVFALVAFDELYFKVGDRNRADYESTESHPFVYDGFKKKKKVTMPYWLLPLEIMENPSEIEEWVEKSLAVNKEKKKK